MIVKEVIVDVKALGHTVWFDQELSGGQKWWDQILKIIKDCDLFVFALSQKSSGSRACQLEYEYANNLNKRILPFTQAFHISTLRS